jgi:hypothetical protein
LSPCADWPGIGVSPQFREVLVRVGDRHLDAWEAYHRGMWHFSKGNDNVSTARDFFEKSVNLDPNFVAAYAALAGSTMVIAYIFPSGNLREAAQTGEYLRGKLSLWTQATPSPTHTWSRPTLARRS